MKNYYRNSFWLPFQILIGVLKTSSETGRPRLCDKSGYLDTVIAGCHGDDIAHLGCHNDRCCDTKQLGDSFSCPYLHNCCIGKIVAVNRYTVAMETFVTQGNQQLGPTTSSNDLKCHKVLYIEFSLSDAIILGDTLKKNKGIFQESNNQRCRTAANTASQKTAKFKDKDPALGRLKVEDKKKIDIENMKPSDKVNIEKDGMLSKVANANETKEKKDTVVSNDTDTETVTSMSMLHRHVSAAGGSYFCRKMNCSESRDKCVPVLSVKPIAKKRKSPECHDKTNSKILCVSKQRSPDSFKHQRSDMDAGVSSILDNSPSDTRKIVTETKSKSDEFTECYSKLRTQFDMVWSESRCIVKVNSRESAVIDTCTKDGMSVMFNVQAQIWKDGNFEPEVSFSFSSSPDAALCTKHC